VCPNAQSSTLKDETLTSQKTRGSGEDSSSPSLNSTTHGF